MMESLKSKPSESTNPRKRQGRKPKKLTVKYLHNVALFYLERFSATRDSLRQVLKRRVRKSARFYELDETEVQKWHQEIETLIVKFVDLGLINDTAFAKARSQTLHRRGDSKRMIAAKLKTKGIENTDIENVFESLNLNNTEVQMEAAQNYLKRRRIGPYRTKGKREDFYEKDLAALARAGFSYDISKRALS